VKPNDRFEDQFAALAKRMQPMVDDMAKLELSEELLVEYHAGHLPPVDAVRVAKLAALSPWATDYLAKLQLDQELAAARMDREPLLQRLSQRLAAWRMTPVRSFGMAGAAVVAALVLLLVTPQFRDSPPDFGDLVYQPLLAGQQKSIVFLPGGAPLGNVDPNWSLHTPIAQTRDVEWFVWDRVEGATRYDLQLIGPDGEGLHSEGGLSEPHWKVPDALRAALVSGSEHAWIVEAKGAANQLLARGVARFVPLP
jgi:hypothetical protein